MDIAHRAPVERDHSLSDRVSNLFDNFFVRNNEELGQVGENGGEEDVDNNDAMVNRAPLDSGPVEGQPLVKFLMSLGKNFRRCHIAPKENTQVNMVE